MHILPDSIVAPPCRAARPGSSRGSSERAVSQGGDKLHLQERKESIHHFFQQLPSKACWMSESEGVISPSASGNTDTSRGRNEKQQELDMHKGTKPPASIVFSHHSQNFARSKSLGIYWNSSWICFTVLHYWDLKRCIFCLESWSICFPCWDLAVQMLKPKF